MGCSLLFAGPPFKTDDPQPVDYLHWEFYIASEQQFSSHEANATYPHFEINYGVLSDLQFHILASFEYIRSGGETHYGFSDTEIGFKYRFNEEAETIPQTGFFPIIEIPTGSEKNKLGNGRIQAYLPLWIQKSWGRLTAYGGSGIWYNPGLDRKNWLFTGWVIQYDFSEYLTLGSEIYYQTAQSSDSGPATGFSVGGFVNLSGQQHILFSLGRFLSHENAVTSYIGYQITI
jgi:hypothetical protein